MKQKTLRQNKYKQDLQKLYAKYPEAKKVAERYKVMRTILGREWLSLGKIEQKVLEDILKDAVYVDRLIRRMTEDTEQEEKEILSQEFQLEVLPGL